MGKRIPPLSVPSRYSSGLCRAPFSWGTPWDSCMSLIHFSKSGKTHTVHPEDPLLEDLHSMPVETKMKPHEQKCSYGHVPALVPSQKCYHSFVFPDEEFSNNRDMAFFLNKNKMICIEILRRCSLKWILTVCAHSHSILYLLCCQV